jgi:hypothetical protein
MKADLPDEVQEYKKLNPTVGISPNAQMIVAHKKDKKAEGGWFLKIRYEECPSNFDSWESLDDMKMLEKELVQPYL